jgi:6-phosphogluconolactonase
MFKPMQALLPVALSLAALSSAMYGADLQKTSSETVFVLTNDNAKNEVLTYHLDYTGQFSLRNRAATGGRGSGGTIDPLQSQGALTLSGDHSLLFAINAASGTVSSFHIFDGFPFLVDTRSSGGAFPVAVAEYHGMVYVLNAGGSGAIELLKTDQLGRFHKVQDKPVFLSGTNSGASSISVSPNGQWLVAIEKASNSIDVFPIHPDGTLGTIVTNKSKTPGVFSTVFTPGGDLLVSENQPNGTDISSISSYSIQANGTLTPITQSVQTFGDGNCWNVITPNGKWVYVDNAATSTVAGFSVAAKGSLTPIGNTILSTLPQGAANLDMAISADGKYLFNLQAGAGALGVYTINPDGTLNQLGDVTGLPKSAGLNGIATL